MSESIATCCAIFSILGIVHLVLFGRLFSAGAVSFAIVSVEHQWDRADKAKACYNGAIIYAVALFLSVLARVYMRRNAAAKQGLLHQQHLQEVEALLGGHESTPAAAAAPAPREGSVMRGVPVTGHPKTL